jgi:hypothetical protein
MPSSSLAVADRRIAGRLCVTFFLLFSIAHHGRFVGADELSVYEQTRALYERGELSVPQMPLNHRGPDGRFYSQFTIGLSLLALPFYGLGRLAESALPEPVLRALAGPSVVDGPMRFGGDPKIFFVGLYAPLATGLLLALFYCFERRLEVGRRASLVACLLVGCSTYIATLSTYFLQHTTEAITILAGLYGFFTWERSGRTMDLAWGALMACATLLVRLPAALTVLPVLAYPAVLLLNRSRSSAEGPRALRPLLWLGAIGALAVSVHAAVNQAKWGALFSSPYTRHLEVFDAPLRTSLPGFLFSPGCSVFVYSPLLLLLPWTLPSLWRRSRSVTLVAVGASLCALLLAAKYRNWTGLYSAPGPRYLFDATPLLLLSLGPWLDEAKSLGKKLAVAVLATCGLAVQLVLMSVKWSAIINQMGYLDYRPRFSFLFEFDASPLVASARWLAGGGEIDWWVAGLARGWLGREGEPLAAAACVALWALLLLGSLLWLARAVRATPEERGP